MGAAPAGAPSVAERRAAATPVDRARLARGAALVAAGECSRCHGVAGLEEVEPAPRERSCAGCHEWIRSTRDDADARRRLARTYPLWPRYVRNVKSFLDVPDLGAAGRRLDPAWLARYLRAPYDVRPQLPEGMIRTAWSEEDAAAAAAWLTTRARAALPPSEASRAAAAYPPSARAEHVAAGAALYDGLGCARCHALGGRAASPGVAAAPDLAHARDRLRADDIAGLIADPGAYGLAARMPAYPITAEQAARLRDFLLVAAVPRRAPEEPPADLPLLARRVAYREVRERVLAAVCVHCHMDPARNDEGGPGNTGGITWSGARLDLESWDGVRRGVERDGRRVSILEPPAEGGEPPLVARLRARYVEHAAERAGAHAVAPGGAPGMPLGLLPLSPEAFQLVRSWVAQGAPGPDRQVTARR
jgi:mono/diheme cytochrome c family protein